MSEIKLQGHLIIYIFDVTLFGLISIDFYCIVSSFARKVACGSCLSAFLSPQTDKCSTILGDAELQIDGDVSQARPPVVERLCDSVRSDYCDNQIIVAVFAGKNLPLLCILAATSKV